MTNLSTADNSLPQSPEESTLPTVVLVPGFLDDMHKMRYVEETLRKAGWQPLSLSPQPSDGTVGIDELAQRLARLIDESLAPDARFAYVGFSMGGLIGRYYLRYLGGVERVYRFITVATPHRGTMSAHPLAMYPALQQMTPDSDFLTALNADYTHLERTHFCAVWTPLDLSVTPPSSAYLPGFPHHRIWSPFHATLLMDPLVLRLLVGLLHSSRTT